MAFDKESAVSHKNSYRSSAYNTTFSATEPYWKPLNLSDILRTLASGSIVMANKRHDRWRILFSHWRTIEHSTPSKSFAELPSLLYYSAKLVKTSGCLVLKLHMNKASMGFQPHHEHPHCEYFVVFLHPVGYCLLICLCFSKYGMSVLVLSTRRMLGSLPDQIVWESTISCKPAWCTSCNYNIDTL